MGPDDLGGAEPDPDDPTPAAVPRRLPVGDDPVVHHAGRLPPRRTGPQAPMNNSLIIDQAGEVGL